MVKAVYRDNTFHFIDPVNLQEGEEVELKILPDLEIKKLQGAFRIRDTRTIEEIIESDIF
jgi:predicted DNA-binding antitoxin AbrB/MazE fold protein